MLRLLLFLLGCAFSLSVAAQSSYKKRFSTSGDDEAFYVEVFPDDSYLVAGGSTGGGLGGRDAMLVKFSADGTLEWSKAFGGAGDDVFTHMITCSDGNLIAVGETTSFGAGGLDLYIVKVDPGGGTIWERTAGGGGQEMSRGICEVTDGYVATGGTVSFGSGNWDIFTEKLDLNGNHVWSKAWGLSAADIGGRAVAGSNGEFWLSGFVFVSSNNHDASFLHVNSAGTLLSSIRIGGSGNDNSYYLAAGGAGLIASGNTWTYSGGAQLQPWIMNLNGSGGLVWAKRYPVPGGNFDIMAEPCPDGGLIFTPYNEAGENSDAYLVKTDATGNVTWAKAHSFNGSGRMRHARPTSDGGYVAVGYTTGAGKDMFILKTNGAGNVTNCCPTDAPIVALAVSPATVTITPNNTAGPAATTPPAEEQGVGMDETNLCNGMGDCCLTDAGTMVPQSLTVCTNHVASFTHNNNHVLDGNDLLRFILFSNPSDTLGSIIAISNTPTFAFDPATMETGITYYIAAIAGNNAGGNVDFNDPCLDISNAAQLIWRPVPEVTFVIDNNDVCAGSCPLITANFTGTPPFNLTVNSPIGNSIYIFGSNSGTFQICLPPNTPPGDLLVRAASLVDAWCACP